MCCRELRCHLAQAAYLWRLWERRRKTAVTLSEHAELQERSCGTGQRGETLMETAPTLKSPWTHFLSYSSTFTSKAPLRASKQLFQITSSVQFPMNTSDRDRMMLSQRGKAVIQEIKSNDRALLSCWMCSQTKTRPPLFPGLFSSEDATAAAPPGSSLLLLLSPACCSRSSVHTAGFWQGETPAQSPEHEQYGHAVKGAVPFKRHAAETKPVTFVCNTDYLSAFLHLKRMFETNNERRKNEERHFAHSRNIFLLQ